jgi:hypothetical protein
VYEKWIQDCGALRDIAEGDTKEYVGGWVVVWRRRRVKGVGGVAGVMKVGGWGKTKIGTEMSGP